MLSYSNIGLPLYAFKKQNFLNNRKYKMCRAGPVEKYYLVRRKVI